MKTKGAIERLPSGRYRARRKDPRTNRYRSVGTFDTETEATMALAKPFPVKGKGPTLESLWDDFAKRRQQTSRDYRSERSRWALYVEQHELGKTPIRDLSRRAFKDWLAWMHGTLGLAAQTRKNALTLVRVVLHDAVENGLLEANPARDVRIARREEGRSDDTWQIIFPDQQLALLTAVDAEEWPTVAAMLGLGFRNSEQWRITWEDVDLERREVAVRYSVKGKPTKTGRVRKLPLFGLGLEAFRAAEFSRKGGCRYVFPSPSTNDRRADSSAPHRWKDWCKAAGVPTDLRWYDLRHTCATSLLAGWWGPAWSLEELQRLLGHASRKTTERYAHFLDETLRGAAARTVESHDSPEEAAKYRATFGIRTRDLRFTNPRHLEGFSGLAVEEFHRRSTARDDHVRANLIEATRQAYRMGRSPLAKARVHELLHDTVHRMGLAGGGR